MVRFGCEVYTDLTSTGLLEELRHLVYYHQRLACMLKLWQCLLKDSDVTFSSM